METEDGAKRRSGGLVRKALLAGAFTAALGGAYMLGAHNARKPINELEELAKYPVATGFLDYPNNYAFSVRLNGDKQREVYLQNVQEHTELPLTDMTWRLEDAYQGRGHFVMDGAMKTIEISRWAYGKLGGEAEGPKKIASEK